MAAAALVRLTAERSTRRRSRCLSDQKVIRCRARAQQFAGDVSHRGADGPASARGTIDCSAGVGGIGAVVCFGRCFSAA